MAFPAEKVRGLKNSEVIFTAVARFQLHRRPGVGNRFPPKRSAKASASSGLAKQNTTKSRSSRRRG